MKKTFIASLIFFLLLTNCFLFDTAGFSIPDAVSGKEAKDQILTSALIGAAISPDDTAILALLAPELAKVKEDRYYNKADVDDCANFAMIINLVTINIGGFTCNLEPREYVFKYFY